MVSFRAIPNALTDMTDTEPTVEQIEIYIKGFRFPYVGDTLYIMTDEKRMTARQYKTNPASISKRSTHGNFVVAHLVV